MTALYFAVLRPRGPGRGQAACRARSSTRSSISSATRRARSSRTSAATRARNPIPRAPRTSTTSTSRPARSASASRRRSSPVAGAGLRPGPGLGHGPARGPHGRARRRRRDGRGQHLRGAARGLEARACATPGGSSTTTARASTPWCARGSVRALRGACSAISAGTSSILKYGTLHAGGLRRARRRARCADWIDACPNQLYSALTFQGGAAWRKRLIDDLGDQGAVTALIETPLGRRARRA